MPMGMATSRRWTSRRRGVSSIARPRATTAPVRLCSTRGSPIGSSTSGSERAEHDQAIVDRRALEHQPHPDDRAADEPQEHVGARSVADQEAPALLAVDRLVGRAGA